MTRTDLPSRVDESPAPRRSSSRSSDPRSATRTARRRHWRSGSPWWALAFLVPTFISFGIFSWWPVFGAVTLSMQDTNLVQPAEWVGAENFTRVLADPLLGKAIGNTAYFTLLTIVVAFPLAILLATLMSEFRRLGGLFRTLIYLPVVIPAVVGVLMWKFFYNPDNGLFNAALGWVGLGPFPWLQDAATVMPSLVIQHIWGSVGGTVLIFIAALSGVQRELYEAAQIDGASIPRRFWHVTLPQMRGILLVMLLLQLLGTFQVFTEPFVMTGGGPANNTLTVLMLIYRYAFEYGQYGMAAALSLLFAAVLCVLSGIYLWATRKWSSA